MRAHLANRSSRTLECKDPSKGPLPPAWRGPRWGISPLSRRIECVFGLGHAGVWSRELAPEEGVPCTIPPSTREPPVTLLHFTTSSPVVDCNAFASPSPCGACPCTHYQGEAGVLKVH
jgi:hypothetical protein